MKASLMIFVGLIATSIAVMSPAKHTEGCCIVSEDVLEPNILLYLTSQGTGTVKGPTIDLV
jgi:hypothetical protein